jgi:hypothetical protein
MNLPVLDLNTLLILGSTIIALFLLAIYLRKVGDTKKLLVRIKTPSGEIHKRVDLKLGEQEITLQKGKKDKSEWKVKIGSKAGAVSTYRTFFGTQKVMDIHQDAIKPIVYDYDLKETDQPKFDKKTSKKLTEPNLLQALAAIAGHLPLPPIFWLSIIIGAINLVLTFVIMRGMKLI